MQRVEAVSTFVIGPVPVHALIVPVAAAPSLTAARTMSPASVVVIAFDVIVFTDTALSLLLMTSTVSDAPDSSK
jgi:hypothetical protein